MIIRNESIVAYHGNSALSKTKLIDFINDGPVRYKAKWIDRTDPHDESKALFLGQRFDGLTENADQELARWAPPVPDDAPCRPSIGQRNAKKPSPDTVAAINWWDKWDAQYSGKITVSNEQRFLLQQMLTEFRANPLITNAWDRCERQVTIRTYLPEFDIWVQSRPDGVCLDKNNPLLADVKTCRDMRRFHKDAKSFGYYVQLAIGQWLMAAEGFDVSTSSFFLVVENHRYPRARLHTPQEVDLARGWQVARGAIKEIARRTKENDWKWPVQTEPDVMEHYGYDDRFGYESEE